MKTEETRAWEPESARPQEVVTPRLPPVWSPLVIFLALAVGIGCAGYAVHKREERDLIAQTYKTLASIAELKTEQIMRWRKGRLRDADLLGRNPIMGRAVTALIEEPDRQDVREDITLWLETLKRAYESHSVLLLDAEARPVAAAPGDSIFVGDRVVRDVEVVRRSKEPFLSELHAGPSAAPDVHLDLIAPLFADESRSRVVACLLLRVDPTRFLFPLIQSWPVPSDSAETLLVRREGNEVLFLNELRHRKNSSMQLRFPVNDPILPASRVIRGERGAMEGLDYRRMPVFAFVNSVPGTPWFLIAKIDQKEVLTSARTQTLILAGFVMGMILASGLAVGLMWNRQRAAAYRKLYRAETERGRAEDALRASEERLRLALEAAGAGAWEWDLQTNENFWSEELWKLYGLDPHSRSPSYESWRETVHPDDREKTERAVQEAARSGTELNVEWRVPNPDGSERWLMSRGKPTGDATSQSTRYIGIVLDITERKQTETAVRRWADAFNYCAHGIAIGSPSIRSILTCNPAFARMHAATVDEIAGQPILAMYEPSEQEHVSQRLAEADRVGQVQYETVMMRRDGSTFPVQMDVVSVRDDDGNLLYRVATAQDITRRRQVVDALRDSLEDKVALLKEVHHRVKNNLQVVASLLNLQATRSRNPQVHEALEDTRNRVRSMSLLHELLYASGNLARVNFSAYVDELCQQLTRSYGQTAARIRVETRIARIGLPLEQSVPCGLIVNELVSNALKHGFPDNRSGTITVVLSPLDDEQFGLTVQDDGVGLDAAFDPMATSTLGLQLVSNLAAQLGGRLEIGRGDSGGAVFRVVFPAPSGTLLNEES